MALLISLFTQEELIASGVIKRQKTSDFSIPCSISVDNRLVGPISFLSTQHLAPLISSRKSMTFCTEGLSLSAWLINTFVGSITFRICHLSVSRFSLLHTLFLTKKSLSVCLNPGNKNHTRHRPSCDGSPSLLLQTHIFEYIQ